MALRVKWKNIFFICLGAALVAFGLVYFNMQNQLAEGGFSGIALLLYFLFGVNPAVTTLLLNIPLFIIGWKHLGRSTIYYTIIGTLALSVFLQLFQSLPFRLDLQNDLFLVAIFAGIFAGAGLGVIFRYGGTTGGVDIIARLVHKYIGWPMGRTMFLFDFLVLSFSFLTYLSARQTMYTLVAVFVGAQVIDFIQEGAYRGRAAFIISEHPEEIGDKIIKELNRGVTLFHGQGFFSKQPKKILYCVVSPREIINLKRLVNTIDPHAFVTFYHAQEVHGEGFTLDENKNPIQR